jgi:hypothetical protein
MLVVGAAFSLSFLLSACPGKTDSSASGGGILSFDETADAGEMVREANNVLKEIKQRFKDNEPRLEELETALKEKNSDKVRAISEEFITQINIGTEAGEEAINKIRLAQDKNINEDYREYLLLKTQALEKYVEAFEERRQAAILLRDGYDPKNAAKRDQVVAAFKQREEKFKEIMEEARKSSEEANELAKDSMNRRK